jgi:hypothetical protein
MISYWNDETPEKVLKFIIRNFVGVPGILDYSLFRQLEKIVLIFSLNSLLWNKCPNAYIDFIMQCN